MASCFPTDAVDPAVAAAVREGFARPQRTLPPWLLYDRRGSELFERITALPEYYLTRAEREILERSADEIVALAADGSDRPLKVAELGAGAATKTRLLLRALVRRQGRCLYLPGDVSEAALEGAVGRLRREEPAITVRPVIGTHAEILPWIAALGPRTLVLFLGSSIGNLGDDESVALLSRVARAIDSGGALLLGADRRKSPAVLLPAYDDPQGVTAAFDLNLLVRLNRELGADFDLARWRHVARWNEPESRVEMHLESATDQVVTLERRYAFAERQTIHTESSVKYTRERIEAILTRSGLARIRTFTDSGGRFDLHLARRR